MGPTVRLDMPKTTLIDVDENQLTATARLGSLLARYQAGDQQAANDFAAALQPLLFRYFFFRTANRQLSEDLSQECWMRIHRARASFRLGDPVMPWVYAIARNTRVDQYRRQLTSLPQAAGDGPEPFHDERAALENRMMAETVQQRLSELPDGQREVFLLLKVHGLSMDETARAVGISTSAAKQKAYRAYQRLRSLFGQAGSGQGKEGTSE